MTAIVPTLGRIVYFRLAQWHADAIMSRRAASVGSNPVYAGSILPAMIVAVHGNTPDSYVNLKVMLDGDDTYWATSVKVGDEDGSYHWMPYQIGQAKKVDGAPTA